MNSFGNMGIRADQGAETRLRIVAAAVEAFAEKGFRGASTRDIAKRANTNQGLITYHFKTKDELWRAAADRVFGSLVTILAEHHTTLQSDDPRERSREGIRLYVRFAASHPELFRFMVDEGKNSNERMRWLVDTHLKPRFDALRDPSGLGLIEVAEEMLPHFYYALAGAGSLIFAVTPECRRLTGLDPATEEAIERHADFLARLLVPY